MKKKIIEVDINKLKNSYIKIEFNDYESFLVKEDIHHLNMTENEDEMSEVFPGIFITKKNIFRFIPNKVLIHICNFRDEVKVSLFENESLNNYLHISKGSRKIEQIKCSKEELKSKEILLDSIHFPENETGGGEERCQLKGVLKKMHLYPYYNMGNYRVDSFKDPYLLFDYEEVFRLPDYVMELRCGCWEFCSNRNMKNREYDIVNGGVSAASKLVNKHFSGAVQLNLNDDYTLSVSNGNHRVCFLKHFKNELSLNKIYFEKIYCEDYLSKSDIKKQYRSYNINRNKILDVKSYYLQLENFGILRKEAKDILLNGLDSVELFNYLKDKKYTAL